MVDVRGRAEALGRHTSDCQHLANDGPFTRRALQAQVDQLADLTGHEKKITSKWYYTRKKNHQQIGTVAHNMRVVETQLNWIFESMECLEYN